MAVLQFKDENGNVVNVGLPEKVITPASIGAIAQPETAAEGQILTFNGTNWIAEDAPDTGVTSFNARSGAVTPQTGDYTADMVGAVPTDGGEMTGLLILSGDPEQPMGAATKQYVDNFVQEEKTPVTYSTQDKTAGSTSLSISFAVEEKPNAFACSLVQNATPGDTAAILNIVYDGTNVYGVYFNSTTTAYSATAYSYEYSNGTLTISSSAAANGSFISGNTYRLFCEYGAVPTIETATYAPASGEIAGKFTIANQPSAFICQMVTGVEFSQYHRTSYVVFDGANTYGVEFANGVTYSSTAWSWSYSGGTLTITSTSTDVGGYFHNPGTYNLVAFSGDGGVTAKVYPKEYNATIPASGWASDNGYMVQTVNIPGVNAIYTVSPVLDVVLSGTDAEADSEIEAAFSLISIANTIDGGLVVKCIGETAPEVNIPISLVVWE